MPSFPSSPTQGQTATKGGRTYSWSGKAWEFVGSSGSGSLSGSVTIPASGDQYWADTLLLLNGNGNIYDTSPSGRSVTAPTGVTADGAPKFGSNSLVFSGGQDNYGRLVVDSPDFYFLPSLSCSFTVEAWVYPTSFSGWSWIFCNGQSGASNVPGVNIYGAATSGNLTATIVSASGSKAFALIGPALSLNTWQHVALCYNTADDTARLFLNGSVVATVSRPSGGTWAASSGPTRFGNYADQSGDPGQLPFIGRMDDVRITKAARYVAAFTPATAAYPTYYNAAQTLAVVFS